MNIILPEETIAVAIELFDNIKTSQIRFGRYICEIIQTCDTSSGENTRADVIRYFTGILKASYDTIESYVRTAERFTDEMLDEYSNVAYSILRNTDPSNKIDMELLRDAQEQGWTASHHREMKAQVMYEDPGRYRDPMPKINFIEKNLEELSRYDLPASVLARIKQVKVELDSIRKQIEEEVLESANIIAF
jgi:hypothetical protein